MSERVKPEDIEVHYTPEDLAKRLGMAVGSINNWRVTGEGPKFLKLGKPVRYRLVDIEKWEESRVVQSTSEEV